MSQALLHAMPIRLAHSKNSTKNSGDSFAVEKQRLFTARLRNDQDTLPDLAERDLRRPADVWVPRSALTFLRPGISPSVVPSDLVSFPAPTGIRVSCVLRLKIENVLVVILRPAALLSVWSSGLWCWRPSEVEGVTDGEGRHGRFPSVVFRRG